MTIDAAWQCHSDHEVGSLESGKFADFVVLEEDPTAIEPERLSQIRVLETWVGGRQVFANTPEAPVKSVTGRPLTALNHNIKIIRRS